MNAAGALRVSRSHRGKVMRQHARRDDKLREITRRLTGGLGVLGGSGTIGHFQDAAGAARSQMLADLVAKSQTLTGMPLQAMGVYDPRQSAYSKSPCDTI